MVEGLVLHPGAAAVTPIAYTARVDALELGPIVRLPSPVVVGPGYVQC